jgi:signal peptidase II
MGLHTICSADILRSEGDDMTSRFKPWLLVLVTFAAIGCDQGTKHLARTHLASGPVRSYLADTVRLEYVENQGAFLSLGSQLPAWLRGAVFMVGTSVLLLMMLGAYLTVAWTRTELVAISLLWAGGVSNLIDRALQGRVPDFMNVGVGCFRTGIFNVADIAVTLGAVLVAVDHLRRCRRTTR